MTAGTRHAVLPCGGTPGDALHHDSGEHRTTPPTTSGRALERHETALRRHLAELAAALTAQFNPPLCAGCFEARHGFDPDMGDPVTWTPGDCSGCRRAGGVVFQLDD